MARPKKDTRTEIEILLDLEAELDHRWATVNRQELIECLRTRSKLAVRLNEALEAGTVPKRFKKLYVGGSAPATSKITVDSTGDVTATPEDNSQSTPEETAEPKPLSAGARLAAALGRNPHFKSLDRIAEKHPELADLIAEVKAERGK